MADDDETPVDPPTRTPTKRRVQTQTERDHEGFAAKKERERAGSVPVEVHEDITGQYEGEERKMYRSKRPTDERIERLEDKADRLEDRHDQLDRSVNEINANVSHMRGEMSVLPRLITALEKAAEAGSERETITLTTKTEINKAQAMEPIKAREARRGWITALIAIFSTTVAGVLAIMKAKGC